MQKSAFLRIFLPQICGWPSGGLNQEKQYSQGFHNFKVQFDTPKIRFLCFAYTILRFYICIVKGEKAIRRKSFKAFSELK